jgi:hypothetical protein
MPKPITSGAVVILLAVIASIATEEARMKNHKLRFPGRWQLVHQNHIWRVGHQPAFADNRCSFGSEKSCLDC